MNGEPLVGEKIAQQHWVYSSERLVVGCEQRKDIGTIHNIEQVCFL